MFDNYEEIHDDVGSDWDNIEFVDPNDDSPPHTDDDNLDWDPDD